MTNFILYKDNMSCSTRSLKIVAILRRLGWKIKVSKFGELL